MTLPRLALSVIGDEIGPSLEEMISFAHEHGLKRLDMRTVDGRNLLGMKKEEIIKISRTLEKAGLSVPTFVSPLFKWPASRSQSSWARRTCGSSVISAIGASGPATLPTARLSPSS